MKKKILGSIAVLAVAAVAALNVNFSAKNNDLTDVSLSNVEASAACENPFGMGGGRCSSLTGMCFGDPGNPQCDPWN